MIRRYFLPVFFLLGLGAVLLLLPEKQSFDEIPPEDLLTEVNSPSRFLSTDRVAERLIEEDPSMVLVDLRNPQEYHDYTLPGAVNIPLRDILDEEWQDYLRTPGIEFVFFANGTLNADRGWILCKRKGHRKLFVMEGGLNQWFETIFMAAPPPATAPSEEIDRYQFRMGVRQYLTGGSALEIPEVEAEEIEVTRRKKKTKVEGGC